MKIKLKTTMAGPDGVFIAGAIIEVPENRAVDLVQAGYAEYIGPIDDIPAELETTTAEPISEKTARTEVFKRKRRS